MNVTKFTLIEADKYIAINDQGIWFTDEDWPFADIEHLWAIQWKDDGTPEGAGEIEYDSSDRQNDPACRQHIDKYVKHWQDKFETVEAERIAAEKEQEKNAFSWAEAMQELETQMEEMQKRHQETLDAVNWEDQQVQKRLQDQMDEMQQRHEENLAELERDREITMAEVSEMRMLHDVNLSEVESDYQKDLANMAEDHEAQMESVQRTIEETHDAFFYAQDSVENSLGEMSTEGAFDQTEFENVTVFDANLDGSLFDDAVIEEVDGEDINSVSSSLEGDVDEILHIDDEEDEERSQLEVDLSILDSEFNLEMMFDDTPDEQVVDEIEKLIDDTDNSDDSEVPDAEVPDK